MVLPKVAKCFSEVDVVLAFGDDRSKEDMIEAVNFFIDPSEAKVDNASQLHANDGDANSKSAHCNRQPCGIANNGLKLANANSRFQIIT